MSVIVTLLLRFVEDFLLDLDAADEFNGDLTDERHQNRIQIPLVFFAFLLSKPGVPSSFSHTFQRLKTQKERSYIQEFGPKDGINVEKEYSDVVNKANLMYDNGSDLDNARAYARDLPIRNRIKNEYSHEMREGQQNKHISGTNEYNQYVEKQEKMGLKGVSVVTVSKDELKELFDKYSGTGIIKRDKNSLAWDNAEIITQNDKIVGYTVGLKNGEKISTSCFTIQYHKDKGWHIVPGYMDMHGKKGK